MDKVVSTLPYIHAVLFFRQIVPVFFVSMFASWAGVFCALAAWLIFYRELKPYYKLFHTGGPMKVKQISSKEDFIPLPKWIVVKRKERVQLSSGEKLEDFFSAETTSKLKDIEKQQGHLTHYDCANGLFLDMQLFNRTTADKSHIKRIELLMEYYG